MFELDAGRSTHASSIPNTALRARAATPLGRGRVVALGLNAWAVLVAIPYGLATPRSLVSVLLLLAPIAVLGVGIGTLSLRQRAISTWSLLFLFPVSCAALSVWLPGLVLERPYSTAGVLLGCLSLVAYGVGTLPATERPHENRRVTVQPLAAMQAGVDPLVARWSRTGLLAIGFALAVLLPVAVPRVGTTSDYLPMWDEGAAEAATLTSVFGTAVASGAIALIIGPMLRAPRRTRWTAKQRRRRVLGLLISAAFGALFYGVYRIA